MSVDCNLRAELNGFEDAVQTGPKYSSAVFSSLDVVCG